MNLKKYYFQCNDCGAEYKEVDFIYGCPNCSAKNSVTQPPKGVLKIQYEYDTIRQLKTGKELFISLSQADFVALLPLRSVESFGPLHVGNTPLISINNIDSEPLEFNLWLKDDSQNPTFSFKDRASVLVSAYAKEHGIDTIIAASTGNAGSSLAGICASQQQKAIIFVPVSAPKAKLTQILMYGAKIIPVDGTYDQAFDLSIETTQKYGFFNRNTAYNPLTIEGKKMVAFELYKQCGFKAPDKVFVPVGDGVIVSGVYKGFEDLLRLGIINSMPIIVAVQANGSSNIIENIETDSFVSKPSHTIADSISVDIPRNFYMAKKFLLTYQGECIGVSDAEIMKASTRLSQNTGVFAEPAAAAAFAGFLKYWQQKQIRKNENVVVLLTGSGLKDVNAVQSVIDIPPAVNPNMDAVANILEL